MDGAQGPAYAPANGTRCCCIGLTKTAGSFESAEGSFIAALGWSLLTWGRFEEAVALRARLGDPELIDDIA